MIHTNQVAKDVRIVLNSNFKIKSISDKHLSLEKMLFIQDGHIFNDSTGDYVFVKGGSKTTSGAVYLNEIDVEFAISEKPHYCHSDDLPIRTAFESIQNIVRNFDEHDVLMNTPIAYHLDIENLRKMFNITSAPAL